MSDAKLHPTPLIRDVVREQIRAVGESLRREVLVLAVVITIATIIIGIDIIRGNAESWFDADDWFPMAIAAFLFPFAVWRKEPRFGPSFFWTLPVDRRQLAMSKVFAGLVWLLAAIVIVIVWQLALALLSGVEGAETVDPFAIVGATAAYLFGSALVLGFRHPLRWLIGVAGVGMLLAMVNEAVERGPDRRDILLETVNLFSFLRSGVDIWRGLPEAAQWMIGTFLWLGGALLALFAALSRHGERRRN